VAVTVIDLQRVESHEVPCVVQEDSTFENIVSYAGFFIGELNQKRCATIGMEGGKLLSILRKYHPWEPTAIRKYIKDVLCGVAYYQERCVIH